MKDACRFITWVLILAATTLPARATTARDLADLPLAAQATVSATFGRAETAYHTQRHGDGYRIANPAHALTATFAADRVEVRANGARWDLRFSGYGRGDVLQPGSSAAPEASANRVEYRRGALTEWYVNGPAGLEQGFTLASAPASGGSGALTFALTLSRDLTATLDAQTGGLMLSRSDGEAVVRYGGLIAYDAAGRDLKVWLDLQGSRVLLRVDDTGARYPLVVDPFIQQAKLTASQGAADDEFGNSVAISGDTIVVGATETSNTPGAVYVFVKPAAGWAPIVEIAKLTAAAGGNGDRLGSSVGISGDTVVAGAHFAKVGMNATQGAAYVFVKPPGGWTSMTEDAKLTASDGAGADFFGTSVGISDDVVVIGSPAGTTTSPGKAYVFVKPPGGWMTTTEDARLTASDGDQGDQLGISVGISGDTVIAGARRADIGTTVDQGAVYVFVKPAGGWMTTTEDAKLTNSDGTAAGQLGNAAAISNDTIVAGTRPQVGVERAVYLFVMPAGGWITATEDAKLTASEGDTDGPFGLSVAISDGIVVVGAPDSRGSAYVFLKPGAGWTTTTESAKLRAADGKPGDSFGISVGVDGATVVVGAYDADIKGNEDQGAAYVFTSGGATAPALSPLILAVLAAGLGGVGLLRLRAQR